MQIGLVGVGKMGAGILQRWCSAGHSVVAFDAAPGSQKIITAAGAAYVSSLTDLVASLTPPRVIWLMIPSGDPVEETIQQLSGSLTEADTVIDGGNSKFSDSQEHARLLRDKGINFIDVGVSGGVLGAEKGYSLMIGGDKNKVLQLEKLFAPLSGKDQTGVVQASYMGPAGSGHFVKMVHNAIEYGMMQALGEGFDLLKNGPYKNLDIAVIAKLWSERTIIRSYLMELAAQALSSDSNLSDISAHVDDSGEGRWAVETAVKHAVPFWANTAGLYARFDSRAPDTFAYKIISALRREFGGHAIKKNP